ncbi:MAG TPA: methyltransferase domain-containing protein [Candidatus Sulfotelmatobacter sp.]|nr:methyltransferase domain-containing protein [Candidatus Sulfotelmatobacter sp.]
MSSTNDSQQKDLIRDRFTKTAEVFADFAVSYRAQFADGLARMVSAKPTDTVVDLACGPGTLALQFARHTGWVCAVDLTPAMLDRARATARGDGLGNLGFTIGDVQSLPIGSGSLDLAVTSYSLHHMRDPGRVVSEMARVVKRGGRVGVIDIVVPEDPARAEAANRIEIARDASHTRSLGRRDFDEIFGAAGLRVIASEVHEMPRLFDHWLHVAGWHRGDAVYAETRRLMVATMKDDFAGFHPRYAAADAGKPEDERGIEMVNTAMFIAAEKM